MELKRDEIIKALECCASEEYICPQCPIDEKIKDDCECGKLVAKNALAIIKELTEENERLRAQNETLEINNKDFKYRIYELSRDNEEWEHENKDLECDNDMLRERITEIRADTVRKMQDRLRALLSTDYINGTREHALAVIDQIAKEMLEGEVNGT